MEYPASIEVRTPDRMDNWRPLVQWVLAVPHLVVAAAMEYVAGAVAVVSWFVILFTGRLPAGLANLQIMIIRYTSRAQLYAAFLITEYPPFDFAMTPDDPGGSPVTVTVRPALEQRNRLTVGLRFLWAIPAMLYVLVITIVGVACWVAAFFAVLFTGRWPDGLRSWAMKAIRVSVRLDAYVLLLTDEYPPFSTE